MKYLILLNLCLLSYVGCANKHNRQNDTTNKIQSLSDSCKLLGKDPLSNYCSAIDTNVIHEQEYVIDTVAGDFYIYCRTDWKSINTISIRLFRRQKLIVINYIMSIFEIIMTAGSCCLLVFTNRIRILVTPYYLR